ncbi:haloacid dehalogenase superfamily, subfamily IA, variant 3 with third motif having DD or ED [Sporobacter termitidis DSM 10068]|uniref:Haloacid dehalogenase superfamily, subfamily IA, variant 3 with third motif having DD or ED n=1 Tax=Sporobacter termitidis DSM 10068 TaxID=1123282 RepID=A0A1M5Y7K5_9FIRM|nr:HAD family phosphatase [Sporobacter termitidis]SHI08060.1 haloacid dehalogenase superfamily, subfamily IA, variant 3 with third motif having DD or ED [Sporobacter termitidis DSM 10068]
MTECVIFDMDGVLFDSERLYARAWRQLGAALGLQDIDNAIKYCVGRNGGDIRAYLLSKYGEDFQAEQFALDLRKAFLDIVRAEGLPLKPGVVALLDWLRGRGCRLALATSSGKNSAAGNLEGAGLTKYFSAVVTGDMLVHGKPAPDIYLLACEKLGTPPQSCYAVEDSPNGVRSAHAAGLRTILVPDMVEITEEIEKLAYKKFDSLIEVKAYFEKNLI